MRRKTKRIIVIVIAVWAALPFVVAPLYRLFADKDKAEDGREETVEQQYGKPFSGYFSVEVSPDVDAYNKKRFVFYNNGTAVLQHDNNSKAVYEFYTYESHADGTISLKGDNIVCARVFSVGVEPGRPADVTLNVRQEGDSVVMSGTEDGGGRSFILRPVGKAGYNNITAEAFDAVDFCKSDFAAEPERLWVVTTTRAGVVTAKDSGKVYRYFSKGEFLYGSLEDDGKYVCLPYAGGRSAYVSTSEVEAVGTQERLAALLADDGLRGTSLMKWTKSFPEMERKQATKGYFNGWLAGRKAAQFFLIATVVAAVLLLLRNLCGWDGHSWLVVSKVVLVALTLMCLWYAYSLGTDMLWFIIDNNPIVALGNIVLMTIGASAHTLLLGAAVEDLIKEKGSRLTVPQWVEYVLAVVFSAGSLLLLARGDVNFNEWILVFYAALMLATLPTVISLKRHSHRRGGMVAFMLLCYPMGMVLLVFMLLMKALGEISNTRVKTEVAEKDTFTAWDGNGNSVQIRKDANGNYTDMSGRGYQSSDGESFHPNGISNSDGPYYKR